VSRHSLRYQLRWLFWGAVAGTASICAISFVSLQVREYKDNTNEDLRSTANILSESSTAAIDFSDDKLMLQILQMVRHKAGIQGAMILNTDALIMARYTPDLVLDVEGIKRLCRDMEPSLVYGDHKDHFVMSIVHDHEPLGYLVLIKDDSPYKDMLIRLGFISILIALGVTVLVNTVLRGVRHSLLEPISELSEVTRRVIEDPDFSKRVNIQRGDELGVLCSSFNNMMKTIEDKNALLRDAKSHLEEQVRFRTDQLQNSNKRLVSELKTNHQINEKLLMAKEKAEASDVAKSEFLSVMTHEIRTPMSGIIGMAQLLEKTGLNRIQREYCDFILESANLQLQIMGDILDFTKMEAGDYELERIPLNIRDIVEHAMVQVAPRASAKNIDLLIYSDISRSSHYLSDPKALRQIISNLLNNAVKFTAKGELSISIQAEVLSETQHRVRVEVLDTGIGIPEERIADIFTRFTQVDSSTARRYGGTGLGLAICKNLIEIMGGEIGVHSEEGRGSKFFFTCDLATDSNNSMSSVDMMSPRKKACLMQSSDSVMALLKADLAVFGLDLELFSPGQDYDLYVLDLHKMRLRHGAEGLRSMIRDLIPEGKKVVLLGDYEVIGGLEQEVSGCIAYLRRPLLRLGPLKEMINLLGVQSSALSSSDVVEERVVGGCEKQDVGQKQFLLVDDDPVGLLVLETMIRDRGHTYLTATDGEQALALAKENDFDVVFLDCMMPKMDGYSACRAMGQLGSGRPKVIIALTANASVADRDKCLKSGMDDYLTKPLSDERLDRILEKWSLVSP
jgi:signal transduction histidine kinase